ncbi:MAG: phytanoyl-CoA dioxygenase family protein [Candidatus Korobacteraceae bacterium]
MWQQNIRSHGFAILTGRFASSEVEALSAELNALPFSRSRAGIRHLLGHPVVAQYARDPRLLCAVQILLGADAFPFRATLFDKSQNSNWLVIWHQDKALPLRSRRERQGWGPWSTKNGILYAHAPTAALEKVVALRIHLDASGHNNGPLRILPGTHSLGVLSDEAIEHLATQVSPVNCLVAEGGILAMRPFAVHASSKSSSPAPRRVLHIEYAAEAAIADGLELALA